MTVLKTRSRTISVRLSEEEYIALRQVCSSAGARSVSDLTREAMRAFLNGTGREDVLHVRMNEFSAQMNSLGRRVEELVEMISASTKQADT